MILVIIRMKVRPDKRMELSQTITSLCGSLRMAKGCRCCDFCQSMEDENRLFLLEEWDSQEDLMTHLNSEHFRVLRGAMSLLREPYEMMFHTIFQPTGDGGDLTDYLGLSKEEEMQKGCRNHRRLERKV
jgi:quinol monooxygenase YgiN